MLDQVNDFMKVTTPDFPDAKCVGLDPEIFFPEDSMGKEFNPKIWAAKEICFSCKHRQACSDYAIKEEITDGIFGGMTAKERREYRRIIYKPRSDLGQRALLLRQAGSTMGEIADLLDSTPTAVSKAIARHKQNMASHL